MCDRLGISAWEVIEAAVDQAVRASCRTTPGPGLGGDCIPVVPHFLAWRLREYGYSRAADRRRARGQRADAELRAAEDRRRAQRRRPADQGLADPAARRGLQGRRRTTRASRRASRSCASSLDARRRRALLRPVGPGARARRRAPTRASPWTRRGGRGGRLRRACSPRTASSSRSRTGRARGSSSTRATSSRAARTSSPSEWQPMLLILGAGYIGAAVAELALERGEEVVLADNWYATDARAARRARAAPARASRPPTSATARRSTRCSAGGPRRVLLLAAQASRPISERDPDYTEETNLTGARRVAEAVAASGARRARVRQLAARLRRPAWRARSAPDAPYGEQGDLAHLSKIYARARARHARAPRRLRARQLRGSGSSTGPSPVEHDAPGLPDRGRQVPPARRGRRAAAARRRRPGDDRRRARRRRGAACCSTARCPAGGVAAYNVAAETRDRGRRRRAGARARAARAAPAWTLRAAVRLRAPRRGVPRAMRLLVTGATGFLGWRAATLLRERGHDVLGARPPGRRRARARRGPGRRRARRRRRPGRARPRSRARRRPALRRRPRPGRRARTTRRAPCARTPARRVNLLDGCLEHGAGADLPVDRARGARAAARRLRALQAPRRGGLPPPRRRARPSCG